MTYFVGDMRGVTVLGNVMYVVCRPSSTILLYKTDTCSPFNVVINVTGMKCPIDIVVCRDDRQLYVADQGYCIWRVSADDHSDQEKWLPTESTTDIFHVDALSVTSRRLLVTSLSPPSLHEYSTTDRKLLRVVQLPEYMWPVYHGVETTHGTFVVGHRGTSEYKDQYAVSELIRICFVLMLVLLDFVPGTGLSDFAQWTPLSGFVSFRHFAPHWAPVLDFAPLIEGLHYHSKRSKYQLSPLLTRAMVPPKFQ